MEKIKTVTLRESKPNSKGMIALYLEYYEGYSKTDDGKSKIKRTRKNTGFYLIAKPKTTLERSQNKESRQKAEAIKSKIQTEIMNNTHGFQTNYMNADFTQYLTRIVQNKIDTGHSTVDIFRPMLNRYLAFIGNRRVTFAEVDIQFCEDFTHYLSTVESQRGGKLSSTTVNAYLLAFTIGLKKAVEDDIITKNPMNKVSIPKKVEKEIVFLTKNEIKILAESECRAPVVKNAFLFSCLTGLRYSDIKKLTWEDVRTEEEKTMIVIHQQKTKGLLRLPLNQTAIKLMGNKGSAKELIFYGLPRVENISTPLKKWIATTSITKNVTFHCGRHTAATLLINNGVDVYTVKNILGHRDIATTMKYAHLVNETVENAIATLPVWEL